MSLAPQQQPDWKNVYEELQALRCALDRLTVNVAMCCPALLTLKTLEEKKRCVVVIKSLVAEHYRFSTEQIDSRNRTEQLAWVRQVAMVLSREITELPMQMLGDLFGRDHGTIMHAIQHVSARCSVNPELKADIEAVRNKIKSKIICEEQEQLSA